MTTLYDILGVISVDHGSEPGTAHLWINHRRIELNADEVDALRHVLSRAVEPKLPVCKRCGWTKFHSIHTVKGRVGYHVFDEVAK